jgi:hypothetical protein
VGNIENHFITLMKLLVDGEKDIPDFDFTLSVFNAHTLWNHGQIQHSETIFQPRASIVVSVLVPIRSLGLIGRKDQDSVILGPIATEQAYR